MSKIDTKARHEVKGSIFEELGMPPAKARIAEMKSDLHYAVMRIIDERELTQQDLVELLDVSQPRVSELLNGKVQSLTLDKLSLYLYLLGHRVTVATEQIKKSKKTSAA